MTDQSENLPINVSEDESSKNRSWCGDVLDRKPYADFLTNYVIKKSKDTTTDKFLPFTIAIDDDWGRGKTFFVKNWMEDLNSVKPPYKTVYFDSWAADCVSDPLLSFMSELLTEIEKSIALIDQLPQVSENLKKEVRHAFIKMGSAVMPASKVLLSGLLKKTLGTGLDEIEAALSSTESPPEVQKEGSTSNAVFDKLFEEALKEQSDKRKIISDFREKISSALELLQKEKVVQLPVFVFVDELDRSRPDFSIQLLEGIKHLFDIPGLCFVVSTNVDQLAKSVKGVYGAEFDGRKYLDRLFDVRYTLPRPTTEQYSKKLVSSWNPGARKINCGVPRSAGVFRIQPNPASVLTWVSEVFLLDLRSTEKVFNVVRDASDGLPEQIDLEFLWMCFLAAVRHKSPEWFGFIEDSVMGQAKITELFEGLGINDQQIEVWSRSRNGNTGPSHLTLRKSVEPYLTWYKKTSKEIFDYVNSQEQERYMGGQLDFIHREFNGRLLVVKGQDPQIVRSSIYSYLSLIRNAGFLEYSQ